MVQVKQEVVAVRARAQEAITAMAQRITPATDDVAVKPRLKTLAVPAVAPPAFQVAPLRIESGQIESGPQADAAPLAAAAPPPLADAQPAAAPPPAAKEVATALSPAGTGDPDATTCRVPQQLPGLRLPGPQVCMTNRQWAELRARHQDIAPDGRTIVYLDGAKRDAALCNNIRTLNWATSNTGKLPSNFCF
jgi:hypothetical protein